MARLDLALAGLLARTGAQAARVVDGLTGCVVAQAGFGADEDIATLVRLARDAVPGPDDLVVATGNAVHVLRVADVPGTFLHIRLGHSDGDVAAARRELASPALQDAVLRSVDPRPPMAVTLSPGPRRRPGPPSAGPSSVLDLDWSDDLGTLRRVATGLRRLGRP